MLEYTKSIKENISLEKFYNYLNLESTKTQIKKSIFGSPTHYKSQKYNVNLLKCILTKVEAVIQPSSL